jgi:hypothetical protein
VKGSRSAESLPAHKEARKHTKRPYHTGYKAAVHCLRLFIRGPLNTALVEQEKELPTKGVPATAELSPTSGSRSLQRISY